LALLAIFTKIR